MPQKKCSLNLDFISCWVSFLQSCICVPLMFTIVTDASLGFSKFSNVVREIYTGPGKSGFFPDFETVCTNITHLGKLVFLVKITIIKINFQNI